MAAQSKRRRRVEPGGPSVVAPTEAMRHERGVLGSGAQEPLGPGEPPLGRMAICTGGVANIVEIQHVDRQHA